MDKRYRVVIAESGKEDVKRKKRYILENFKYRDYAENYSRKIKRAAKELDTFPTAYESSGFIYRGYEIFFYPKAGHLLFFTVDERTKTVTVLRVLQDGMDWESILGEWIKKNR